MSAGDLSDALVAFVRQHIGSIEILEVLLLLRRESARALSADESAAELRIQPRSAAQRLATLTAAGLAKDEGGKFRWNPTSPHADIVAELADAYQTRRVSLIELIFSRPPDNVRLFADAFVIKGKKDG